MEKFFSIVIPIYNAESVLKSCLDSIMNQNYSYFEVLMINDGSKDNSKKICEEYSKKDERFLLVNQKNRGVSAARNEGIKKAKGRYLIFVDADDTLSFDFCDNYAKVLSSTNVDMIISGLNLISSNRTENVNIRLNTGKYTKEQIGSQISEWYRNGLLNTPWSKCFKRSLISTFFNSDITLGEDLIFNLNYLLKCNTIYFLNRPLYNYIISNPNSLSSKYHIKGFENLNIVYNDSYRLFIQNFGEKVDLKELDKKYVTDFCVMAERLINYNKITWKEKKRLLKVYSEQILKNLHIKNIVPDAGNKWKLYWILIYKYRFKSFACLVILIKKISKIRSNRL